MTGPKSKISATLLFSETGKIQSVNLNAETDGDAAALSHALKSIIKRPEDEMEELAIRFKWLIAIIEKATLEIRLARFENHDDESRS